MNEQAHGHSAATTSLAHRDPPAPHAALLMAQELLRYRPTEGGYDAWLGRITELVDAARDGQAPSRSLPAPPSRADRAERDAPPPPPNRDVAERRPAARALEPSRGSLAPDCDSDSCQIIRRAPPDARVVLEKARNCQDRVLHDVAMAGR